MVTSMTSWSLPVAAADAEQATDDVFVDDSEGCRHDPAQVGDREESERYPKDGVDYCDHFSRIRFPERYVHTLEEYKPQLY